MLSESSSSSTSILQGQYGFAKLENDIFLIQVNSSPAPKKYQVHVFRHDFVSVFPYSHTQIISSSDLLEVLEGDETGDQQCWFEQETSTVFVAQDVMSRFVRLKDMLVPSLGVWGLPRRTLHRRFPDGRHSSIRSGLAAV